MHGYEKLVDMLGQFPPQSLERKSGTRGAKRGRVLPNGVKIPLQTILASVEVVSFCWILEREIFAWICKSLFSDRSSALETENGPGEKRFAPSSSFSSRIDLLAHSTYPREGGFFLRQKIPRKDTSGSPDEIS